MKKLCLHITWQRYAIKEVNDWDPRRQWLHWLEQECYSHLQNLWRISKGQVWPVQDQWIGFVFLRILWAKYHIQCQWPKPRPLWWFEILALLAIHSPLLSQHKMKLQKGFPSVKSDSLEEMRMNWIVVNTEIFQYLQHKMLPKFLTDQKNCSCCIVTRNPNTKIKNWFKYGGTQHRLQK